MGGGGLASESGISDPVITRLVAQDKVRWWNKPNLRLLYLLLFPTCMGIEFTSGFDSQLINALQIVPSWISYYHSPQGNMKGFIAASYSLGAILSLPLVPLVTDKFGRRWAILSGSVVMVIGSILQGLAIHVAMYIISRMVIGFGIPICIVAASSLIGELSYPKERPMMTSLFNVSYFVGQITAATICFGTNQIVGNSAWRIPSFLQMVPSVVQISLVLLLPESPRWLIANDRGEEAYAILAKYHAEGDMDSEFVRAEYAQMSTTIKLELEASKRSWVDLISTSGQRKRLGVTVGLGLFTQWSGNTLISYYLGDLLKMIGYTSSNSSLKINISIACWSLFCGVIVSYLVLRTRRRVMYMICVCSLLCVYVGWTVAMQKATTAAAAKHPNQAANVAVLFFIYAYSPCYNIGYNALTYTYMVEIWPFAERTRGISIFQLFGRLAGFFTTFVNAIGLATIKWKYLITYCCILVFEIFFVYFLFPETHGRTLEELAFIFEDKAKADEAVRAVEKAIGHEAADVHVSDIEKQGTTRTEEIKADATQRR